MRIVLTYLGRMMVTKNLIFFSFLFTSCVNELLVTQPENDAPESVIELTLNDPGDQALSEGQSGYSLDFYDTNTNQDIDQMQSPIGYSCKYDIVVDDSVSSPADCSSITGLSFIESTGTFSWVPATDAFDNGDGSGRYEFKIIAESVNASTEAIFVMTITDVLLAPPGTAASEEWIEVPADAGGLGLPSFWVMKYEAKAWDDSDTDNEIDPGEVDTDGLDGATDNWGNATHKPVSIADNQPWREIDANGAAAECESLGAGYDLISNDEWMAIARDAEGVAENWTGNSVGTGCLFRGNSGETATGDGNGASDSCGYNGADPEEGSVRDIRAKLKLSNGEEVYDFAGNVSEWSDWDDPTSPSVGFQTAPDTSSCSHGELTSVAGSCGGILADTDYNTSNGGYTITQGVGYFYRGSGSAALRGGSWGNGTVAGAFYLGLYSGPSVSNNYVGFRCVYRP